MTGPPPEPCSGSRSPQRSPSLEQLTPTHVPLLGQPAPGEGLVQQLPRVRPIGTVLVLRPPGRRPGRQLPGRRPAEGRQGPCPPSLPSRSRCPCRHTNPSPSSPPVARFDDPLIPPGVPAGRQLIDPESRAEGHRPQLAAPMCGTCRPRSAKAPAAAGRAAGGAAAWARTTGRVSRRARSTAPEPPGCRCPACRRSAWRAQRRAGCHRW